MAYMTNGKRDYKKELAWEKKKKPNRVKDRAKRNAARKLVGLKKGDPRQVDHKDNNPKNNKKTNLRVVSAKTNLKKEANRKKKTSPRPYKKYRSKSTRKT
jgi:precorrin-6B methylase 1